MYQIVPLGKLLAVPAPKKSTTMGVMRRIFLLVFALIVALVACLGLLLYRPSLWPEVAARIGAYPVEAPPSGERESPFAKVEPQIKLQLPTLPPPDMTQQQKPASVENVTRPPAVYRFPTGADIKIGAAKPDIIAIFGPPQVGVTGADRGQLQERLIYTDRSTGQRTTIAVVDGKVTSAETVTAAEMTQE